MDISTLSRWLSLLADAIHEHRDELTALDAAIGDADHGINMDRGFAAVTAQLPEWAGRDRGTLTTEDTRKRVPGHGDDTERELSSGSPSSSREEGAVRDCGTILTATARALISTVGGASGPLYGTAFLRMGAALSGKAEVDGAALAAALQAAQEGIAARGRSAPGEKTMLDAWAPATAAFRAALAAGQPLVEAARSAATAAEEGMRATIPMVATKGRAANLGPRSAGHQDPGATSTALLFRALAEALAHEGSGTP